MKKEKKNVSKEYENVYNCQIVIRFFVIRIAGLFEDRTAVIELFFLITCWKEN